MEQAAWCMVQDTWSRVHGAGLHGEWLHGAWSRAAECRLHGAGLILVVYWFV